MGWPDACLDADMSNQEKTKASSENRFELRDAPGPAGKVIDSFATREEADVALRKKQEEMPGVAFTLADMGTPSKVSDDPEENRQASAEAKKSLEEKQIEKAREDSRKQEDQQAVDQTGAPTQPRDSAQTEEPKRQMS